MMVGGYDNRHSGADQQLLINPFIGKTEDEMVELTDKFLENTNIDEDDHESIRKGAFLAQSMDAFTNKSPVGLKLKPDEERALEQEDPKKGNKWDQPFLLYALIGCCSMGAAVQGWDESAVNQAQIHYHTPLGIDAGHKFRNNAEFLLHPSVLLGLVNCAPYLSCAVVGCWLTDPLNKYLGRRGTIFLTCLISSVTCLGQGFAKDWQGMFVARLFLGLGIGPKSATVPVYAAESSPQEIRGSLVMMWQMWTAFGIMLGFVSGVVFQSVEVNLRWRLVIGSPMVLPLIVCAYVFILPESPRWLLSKARRNESKYYVRAFDSLKRLRRTKLQAARDLFMIYHMLKEEEKIKQHHNRFIEMFTVARNRRALRAGVIVMFFQQFCGVNVLAFYSSLIFMRAGFTDERASQASMGFGILNFVFAIPAVRTIDTFGRRNLLLFTFPFMMIFQLFTALAFLAPDENVRKGLVATGMYLFAIAYSPGEGPVPFTYCSECMPLYVRDLGMSVFTATLWFLNFLLSITLPKFIDAFTPVGTFAYYAAWCFVGWWLILLFVPETGKNQSLEQLDHRFMITTKVHAKHGIQQLLYFIRRYCFLRRRTDKPELVIPVYAPESRPRQGPRHIPLDQDNEKLAGIEHDDE